jgi:protein gp37
MADKTNIAWTKRTWNPWWGCSKISAGCLNCYMFLMLLRFGLDPRVVKRTQTWNDPIRWNRRAAEKGVKELVFTCSMSDFFHKDADAWRPEAWEVIRRCPNLIFQVLTKRSDRIADHLPPDWGTGYPNVWLGVSIENNNYVARADDLRAVPAAVRFISAEPLLGPLPDLDLTNIDWVIAGGESGPRFRPMEHEWAMQVRDMTKAAGAAFFFKQSSDFRPERGTQLDGREWRELPIALPMVNVSA